MKNISSKLGCSPKPQINTDELHLIGIHGYSFVVDIIAFTQNYLTQAEFYPR
ncbi:hypothetical protein NSP_31530 [Nodularia spumigena CCY9414]|nr:hypothetical protein NSP_31530 [Nodularia spumigena CCY9414]